MENKKIIEISGDEFEIEEGVEYTVPSDEAENMGAFEDDSHDKKES